MTNNDFLPAQYEPPKNNSKYTKFEQGETKIRILSPSIVWFEYFNNDNKPVRSRTQFTETPNIKSTSKVKEFWAFVVWNYTTESLEICEITQAWIKKTIFALYKDVDFGDPKNYDIKITRTGEWMETEYAVLPWAIKVLDDKIKTLYDDTTIDLEALYDWSDPFAPKVKEELDITDVPF